VKLRDIAHARTGDKGDTSNISVIAYRAQDFALLQQAVTADAVRACLKGVVKGDIACHALPQLGALNVVLQNALGGGVTRSLALDAHGKCLSGLLLDLEIPDARLRQV
jgi:hypothetical protein